MKKTITVMVAALLLGLIARPAAAENPNRGGPMGFIAGCCFGIRTAAAYNDGKEVHWRQWCRLIPCVGVVFAIWDGVDGVNGVTTSDYAAKYGASYY
jgi:hypothetical protein